jgi:hypothetical protein
LAGLHHIRSNVGNRRRAGSSLAITQSLSEKSPEDDFRRKNIVLSEKRIFILKNLTNKIRVKNLGKW